MTPRKIVNTKRGPEREIQDRVIKKLRGLGWIVKETHGNMYQSGFPDLYAAHKSYGSRWIEIKYVVKYAFTPAQLEFFPQLQSVGIGVWILVDDTDSEYSKLFRPANWYQYLSVMR
jgi:hypothetical protein